MAGLKNNMLHDAGHRTVVNGRTRRTAEFNRPEVI